MPTIRPEMEKVYSFDMGRENRSREYSVSELLQLALKDRERYLQKYCIDAATGMLLDYILVGKSHKPVEQFMFTSIEIKSSRRASINKRTAKLRLNYTLNTACADRVPRCISCSP